MLEKLLAMFKDKAFIEDLHKGACTFNALYNYWSRQLYERVMRLFVWNDTEEVPPKEIEQRLVLSGYCGVTKIRKEKELTAVFGTMFGPTKYYDIFKEFCYSTPIDAGTRKIGKNIVVIDNNATRCAVYPLIHHYAQLLAHAEVTFIDMLINARDSSGIPIATTEKQKQSIISYQGKKFNGQYGVVTDLGALGINYAAIPTIQASLFKELWETRNNILKEFYADIGVKAAFEKQSNTVDAEVKSNNSLLLLNVKDMIAYRQKGCEEVNKMFGKNWSVEIAKEIQYDDIEVKEEATDEER